MKKILFLLLLYPAGGWCDTPLAARTLPSGTLLQPEDIYLPPDDTGAAAKALSSLLGQQTRVTIYEGRPINASQLTPPHVIARNQIVMLIYETALMRIESEGRALEPGQEGQTIRVMNLSSRATVSGRVTADGTVMVQ